MTADDNNQQWYPEPSQEQQDLQEQQERNIVASMPVLQGVLDWFDAQITTYKDPKTITGVNPGTAAEDVKAAVLLAQALIQDYENQRNSFVAAFDKYIQEPADAA